MTEEKKKRPKILVSYDIRKGIYPIRISLQTWEDSGDKPYIELYQGAPNPKGGYKNNSFKIRNRQIWAKIRAFIDTSLLPRLQVGKISERQLEREVKGETEALLADNVRLKKMLQNQTSTLRRYRQNNITAYQATLKAFEKLLDTAKKEEELQEFLANNTWLLGAEYEHSKPQKIAPRARYDFYVERYDGFADIIEIKKSKELLFDPRGKLSKNTGAAIQQLIEYVDDAMMTGDSKRMSKKYEFSFLKPKGTLILGRTNDGSKEKLAILNSYFHNIEILSYDDILKRGQSFVAHFSKGGNK